MAFVFGVDSALPANRQMMNGYLVYDWVRRQGGFPAFWGRDLDGEYALTPEEAAFLRDKGCKIALLVRSLTENGVSGCDGTADALRAVEAARALGVPQHEGIALFAEIQPEWSVNHNWMISFAQVVAENGYVPGFIGNTDSSSNFNFDRQCSHYVQATADVGQFGALYWAAAPRQEGEPADWSPYCPSALTPEAISFWRRGTVQYNFCPIGVNETYARDEALLARLW